MKALVCYVSKTGNTRKVAEVLARALPCEKDLLPLESVGELKGYDLVFLGFPIWEFGPADPARQFLEARVAGARLAMFITHAMPSVGEPPVAKMIDRILGRCRRTAEGAQVLGVFHCRGELSQPMADDLERSGNPMLQHFARTRPETLGHPDESELAAAREFAAQMLAAVGG
ncbi:MAG TPA: flavodoxin family protein [Myxococcales bacterium]|jgi:flavodoxin